MNWVSKMHSGLLGSVDYAQVARTYREWKARIMVNPVSHSVRLLNEDRVVCEIFYTVLQMISASNLSDADFLDEIYVPDTNFQVVAARRAKEEKRKVQDDLLRMETRGTASEVEARIRLQRRSMQPPTFKDVLEDFARENQLEFHPRVGAKSSVDGKQVFVFGGVLIYIESDVIFAFKDSEWNPVSLDQLSTMAAT